MFHDRTESVSVGNILVKNGKSDYFYFQAVTTGSEEIEDGGSNGSLGTPCSSFSSGKIARKVLEMTNIHEFILKLAYILLSSTHEWNNRLEFEHTFIRNVCKISIMIIANTFCGVIVVVVLVEVVVVVVVVVVVHLISI